MKKTSNNPTDTPQEKNLFWWFWGTIILFTVVSILLTIFASLHQKGNVEGTHNPNEFPPTVLERVLSEPNTAALTTTKALIDPLLDKAYAPVYLAISDYTEFHFSLKGEYIELTSAALGYQSKEIQARLFSGLQERLSDIAKTLDTNFETTFKEHLAQGLANTLEKESEAFSAGPLTQAVTQDAKNRIAVIVPVAGAAVLGGSASIKVASKLIAKKIGAKVAAKAAAKTGAKWAATASGAGSGAVLCSWAGPGAGICAAGGAVIAWVAVDVTVLKLDEFWSRDDFENELRLMIDNDKAERKKQLENALRGKANEVQKGTAVAIADFTLKQLSEGANSIACSTAASLASQYNRYSNNLRQRSTAALSDFRKNLNSEANSPILTHLVSEIEQNIANNSSTLLVDHIKIQGNFPVESRENRDVSARIYLNVDEISFDRTNASESTGFILQTPADLNLGITPSMQIQLTLEQHLRVFRNRIFMGKMNIRILDTISNSEGLKSKLELSVPISINSDSAPQTPSQYPVSVEISLSGKPLPELKNTLSCAN